MDVVMWLDGLIVTLTVLFNQQVLSQDMQCGSVLMNKETTLCCNGLLYVKSGVRPACCGPVAYDDYYFICCRGGITQKRHVPGLAQRCCNSQAYNSQDSSCSNRVVLQRKQEVGSTCCRTDTGWKCCFSNEGCCSSAGSGSLDIPGFKPVCCHLVTTAQRSKCCNNIIYKTGVTARCCNGNRIKPPGCCRKSDNTVGCCEHRSGYTVTSCCLNSNRDVSHPVTNINSPSQNQITDNTRRPTNHRDNKIYHSNSNTYSSNHNTKGHINYQINQQSDNRVHYRDKHEDTTQHPARHNSEYTSIHDCCNDSYPRAHCCPGIYRKQVTVATTSKTPAESCCSPACCRSIHYRSKCCSRSSQITCCTLNRQEARNLCCLRVQYKALCCSTSSRPTAIPVPTLTAATVTFNRITGSPLSCCKSYQQESCCLSGLKWSGSYPLCCNYNVFKTLTVTTPDFFNGQSPPLVTSSTNVVSESLGDEILEAEELHRIKETRRWLSTTETLASTAGTRVRKALCSGVVYNTHISMCCMGVKQPKKGPHPACCAKTSFDTTIQQCCNGQVKSSC